MLKRLFASAVLLLTAAAGVTQAASKLNVMTATQDLASLAREVGGDLIVADSIAMGYQDPHFVEAKPSFLLKLQKADLLVVVGLQLEIGWLPPLITQSRNAKIQVGAPGYLDMSQSCQILEIPTGQVTRAMGDVHPLGNPHYHYSPARILSVAEGMAAALSVLDPPHADAYKANLATFREKVRAKQKEWSALPTKGRRFIAYHKLFEYLASDFGFTITAYVEPKPGIPPSAGYIERLIETIRQSRPNGILTTPIYGRKEVDFLTQKTGVRGIVIPNDVGAVPGAKDWFSFMDQTLSALVK